MGWFSGSSSSSTPSAPTPAESAATTTAFPDKSRRRVCWAARDAYLACLDRTYGVDAPSADPQGACKLLLAEFHAACPGSWVKHFMQKREAEIRDRKLGLRPPKQVSPPPPAPSSAA